MSESKTHSASTETGAWSISGYLMLILMVVLVILTAARVLGFASGHPSEDAVPGFIATIAALPVAIVFMASGFYMIQPNQATVITLFGEYRGTERREGLRWVWPWMMKNKMLLPLNRIPARLMQLKQENLIWRYAR